MGFPILVRLHLYIESGPRIIPNPNTCTIQQNMYSRLVPVAQLVRVLTTNPKVSSPHGVRYFLSQNFKCYSRTSICQLKINAVARVWLTFLISTSSTTIYMNLQASKNFVIKLVTIVAGHQFGNIPQRTGSRFNIKTPSYQYRKSHCGDKTILRPSYLHNGISYTGKMTSLYWIRAQDPTKSLHVMRQQSLWADLIR